jgi:hypothetical protein
MFGRVGTFLLGGSTGAYVAQTYSIPNVADQVQWAMKRARELESEYAKVNPQQTTTTMSHVHTATAGPHHQPTQPNQTTITLKPMR